MLILRGRQSGTRLGIPLHYALVLPEEALSGERYPLILCLHDLGQSGETLLPRLSGLADELHVGILLPDGRRSCFADMAHGPCWATALATDVLGRLQVSLRILLDRAGVIGIGTGALGAMQLAKRARAARFVCATVNPALDTPFAWDEKRWPSQGEWLGVFDGQQAEFRYLIREAENALFQGDEQEKLRQAFAFCAERLSPRA